MKMPSDEFEVRNADIEKKLKEIARLRQALKESVWLQSHYAALLNMYDGGKRMTFDNENEWLERLDRIMKKRKDLNEGS